jgi:hypothetical protein
MVMLPLDFSRAALFPDFAETSIPPAATFVVHANTVTRPRLDWPIEALFQICEIDNKIFTKLQR